MPNWCGNQTTIEGLSENLDDFFQRISNPAVFSTDTEIAGEQKTGLQPVEVFSRLLPVPENGFRHLVINEGMDNERTSSVFARPEDGDEYIDGYAWCLANWGTKWGDCDTDFELFWSQPKGRIVLTYTTAWGPAFEGWINVSKLFPKLSFVTTYEEEGNGICGAFSIVDGEVRHDDSAHSGDGRYPEHSEDDECPNPEDDGESYGNWLDEVYKLRDQMGEDARAALLSA